MALLSIISAIQTNAKSETVSSQVCRRSTKIWRKLLPAPANKDVAKKLAACKSQIGHDETARLVSTALASGVSCGDG